MSRLAVHSIYMNLGFMLLFSALLNVGVHSQQHGDVRLSGYGSSRLAGRLEIYLHGEWGTVCGNKPRNIPKVVCRQLRLGHPILQETESLRYGLGNGTIWLKDVSCGDDEVHLLRCSQRVNSQCDHHNDISVMCSGIHTPYEGEIRLVNGEFASEGTVELYLHNHWAPVCSTNMEPGLADTVCRQLGYTMSLSSSQEQNTTGPFWPLPPAQCPSSSKACTKDCLPDLLSSQLVSSCPHNTTSWRIVCGTSESGFDNATSGSANLCALNSSTPENGTVRLYGDERDQGRVEVFFDGVWAPFLQLRSEAATVVCKQSGFPAALFSTTVSQLDLKPLPTLPDIQYTIDCDGLESHINSCNPTSVIGVNHNDDAYVHCSSLLIPFGSLQLIGGAGPFGRLQLNVDNNFHWLCDAHFSWSEAVVACRQLGYSGVIAIVNNSLLVHPSSSGSSLLPYSFHCTGEENYLLDCQKRSVVSEACRESLDIVAVHCSTTSNNRWKLRLVPSDNSSHDNTTDRGQVREGRVEVLLEEHGEWGTICIDMFSNLSAHVICRQLGFQTYNQVFIAESTDTNLPILLSSVQCSGFEERLDYCPHVLAGRNCTHAKDISVNCSIQIPRPDGSLRLLNSTSPSSSPPQDGRLEISYHGLWMGVCGILFTQAAADVACRQLQLGPAANYCQNACFGQSEHSIHFAEYSCSGEEDSLLQCGINIHNARDCSHDNSVGLSCLPPPQVTVSSVSSLSSSPSPNPSLPLTLSHVTSTSSQLSPTAEPPTQAPKTPTDKENGFISDGIFYVIACVVCLLVLALIIAVTICCVCHKKREEWDLTETTDYMGGNRTNGTINSGTGSNGEVVGETTTEEQSDFDFDGLAESVEMKACAKAVEAMDIPPDGASLDGLPPQYHELEFLSRSIPGEELKELS